MMPTNHRRGLRRRVAVRLVLAICLSVFASAQNEPKEDVKSSFSYGFEADLNSKYVWRGFVCNDHAVLQPSTWINFSNLTFSIWGNLAVGDDPNTGRFDEMDLVLSYAREWKGFGIEGAIEYYHYDHQEDAPPTTELSLKISRKAGTISIFINPIWDIRSYAGAFYGEFGVDTEKKMSKGIYIEFLAGLSYGSRSYHEAYAGFPRAAMSLLFVELGVAIDLPAGLYLKPHAAFYMMLDDEIRKKVGKPDQLTIGLALGLER